MNDYKDNRPEQEFDNEQNSEYADIFADDGKDKGGDRESFKREEEQYKEENLNDSGMSYNYYQFSNNPPEKSMDEVHSDLKAEKQRQRRLAKERREEGNAESGFKKFALLSFMALILGVIGGLGFLLTTYFGDSLLGKEREVQGVHAEAEWKTENPESENAGKRIPTLQGYKILNDVSEIVKKNKPAMVNISATTKTILQDFFRGSYYQEVPVSGSGFIISEDEENYYIATNHHVIDNGENLSVAFIDNSVAPAIVKGKDAYNDLAVISVSKKDISLESQKNIKLVEIGDSENLVEGQSVIAMGNALGYGQSTTVGVISALNRTIQTEDGMTMEHLIQTDAAINFGNSGGALIDSSGRVIGINSAKNGSAAVEGMGYAIPISKAEPIIKNILSDNRAVVLEEKRGMLGVEGIPSGEEEKQAYGMPVGFHINGVVKGGGAEKAGIIRGDIIVAINGFKVLTQRDIAERLQFFEVGETVEVTIMRRIDGEYKELKKNIVIGPKDKGMLKQELREKQRQEERENELKPNQESPSYSDEEEFRNRLDELLEEMFGRP